MARRGQAHIIWITLDQVRWDYCPKVLGLGRVLGLAGQGDADPTGCRARFERDHILLVLDGFHLLILQRSKGVATEEAA